MFLSLTKTEWINKNKDSRPASLFCIILVLFLFTTHLILIPFTFTPAWHCPMMTDMKPQASMMDMDINGAMSHFHIKDKQDKKQKDPSAHHGIFICPLCNGLALPNPLLNSGTQLPQITLTSVSFKYKTYQGQAPPLFPSSTHFPRAPPRS